MIIGIGSDIVQIPRIERMVNIYGNKFLERIFTKQEIENSKKYTNENLKICYFAKRFAAKEAFVKAIGLGFRINIRFRDIEITNSKLGKPEIKLYGGVLDAFNKMENSCKINVTLSDDYPTAIAFIIISR